MFVKSKTFFFDNSHLLDILKQQKTKIQCICPIVSFVFDVSVE